MADQETTGVTTLATAGGKENVVSLPQLLPGKKAKGKAPPHETIDIGVHTFSLIEIDGSKYVHGHPVYGPFEASELPAGLGLFCSGEVRIDCAHNVLPAVVEG